MIDFAEVAKLFAPEGIIVEEAGDESVRGVCFRAKGMLEEVAYLSATHVACLFFTLLSVLGHAHSKNRAWLAARRFLK